MTTTPALILRAEVFARMAHRDQTRKYTGEPYVHHCRNVAAIVAEVTDDLRMVAAAWLHDTVEAIDPILKTVDLDKSYHPTSEIGRAVFAARRVLVALSELPPEVVAFNLAQLRRKRNLTPVIEDSG